MIDLKNNMIMKTGLLKALPALALLAAAQIQARQTVYDAGPFDRLSQSGDIDIVYRSVPDSTGMVVYDSDRDFSDAIEITNNYGRLSIREVAGHGLGELPVLRVYSDYLSEIKSEGDATIEAFITAATPTLSVRLVGNGSIICDGVRSPKTKAAITTGNGSIVMRGKCNEARFELTGTGVIQADELEAESVKCLALGTGSIGCWPERMLDVRGIGTTKIYYRGDPRIKKVGGARLWQLKAADITDIAVPDSDEADSDEADSDDDDEYQED